ncbi:MAG TPA: DUF2924 domain-containing protein [Myxococcales bacterium]|jgi:hypothetical protein
MTTAAKKTTSPKATSKSNVAAKQTAAKATGSAPGRPAKVTSKPAPAKRPPRQRDARLPAPGTVLTKTSRAGKKVECRVTEAGVDYKGATYRSLSAAGRAAAADLGAFSRAINGYLFWLFGGSRETAVDLWRERPRSLWTGAWTA